MQCCTNSSNINKMNNIVKKYKGNQIILNRLAYSIFLLVGVYYLAFAHDAGKVVVYFGLSLVFDPFNPSVKWPDRPVYQKIIPIVQVIIVMSAFVFMFIH